MLSSIRSTVPKTIRNSVTIKTVSHNVVRNFTALSARSNAIKAPEVISATKIQHVAYGKDAVREELPVTSTYNAVEAPEETSIVRLTKAKYDAMTPMMRKMTVYGKTIIITGFVYFSPDCSSFS